MSSRPANRSLVLLPILLPVCLFSACQDAAEEGESQFTVRGRWPDPMRLSYRIADGEGPLSAADFREPLRAAMDTWASTRVVGFEAAADEDPSPDITFSWQTGVHGDCEAFGRSPGVAHAGPVAEASFIHFDAAREWSPDGSTGLSLYFVALHELGHVLGLGHSDAKDSLMQPGRVKGPAGLSRSELDGIHSLYGGGEDRSGDLHLTRQAANEQEEILLSLRGLAPAGITEFTLFDSDGDGDDELLVWRKDHAGHGLLMIYHFTSGPRLARTLGPIYGGVAPEVPNLFVRTENGERIMFCVYADGSIRVRRLDASGNPGARPPDLPFIVDDSLSDADGDGRLDPGFRLAGRQSLTGDLDGDGRAESLRR